MLIAGVALVALAPAAQAQQGQAADYVRARAADADGAARAAAAGYARALDAAPDDEMVAVRAYRQALEVGDFALAARAAAVLSRAEMAAPDLPLFRLATALEAGDLAAAQAEVDAMAAGPLDFLAPALAGWLALERGEDPLAPLDAPANNLLARRYIAEHRALLLIASGRTAEGVAAVRTLLAGGQEAQDLRIDAARLLALRGDRREARALLSGGGPEFAALRRELGRGAPSGAQFGAARLFLRLAADLAREDTIPLSVVLTRMALRLDPADDRARLYLGDALSRAGSDALAHEVLGEIASDSPYADDAELVRVSALSRAGRTDEALARARQIAERRGASSEDAQSYGDLLAAEEQHDAAARAYALAIERAGADASWLLYYRHGAALENAGRWSEALPALRRAVALGPDQPVALNMLGYAQVERGENVEEAVAMLERANELRPDDPGITDSLGWAYYRTGAYERAVPLLEQAARGAPADSLINEHLGDAYWRVDRRYEARYAWRAAAVYADAEDTARLERKLRRGLNGPDAAAN
ncbi:tetratricopeptide repeat protein [Sphingosinithalassobacter sp. CS137]|uniref:tetratricopeptide repeat protein n=1 Tax=Sphingosinithalassobacter sp. CS137 TaxID=2762748 RepID=UPI00165D77D9|nr:tetratricopeptide repeat protein [Sphingosinithalassobacter sp. CS137]